MNETSYCVQGRVHVKPAVCNEFPYSLKADGRIYYKEAVYLTKTRINMFGYSKEVRWDDEMGYLFVKALNDAYKAGYEKDQVTYE